MELLQQFEQFITEYIASDPKRHSVNIGDLEDEVGGLVGEITEFCGMEDPTGYVIQMEPLDASAAVRWLDKYCTRFDDEGDPEAWVASDFSFFAFISKDFKLTVFSEALAEVPTFESWVARL